MGLNFRRQAMMDKLSKWVLLCMVFGLGLFVKPLCAIDMDVLVDFDQRRGYAGRFYYDVYDQISLVGGVSTYFPGESGNTAVAEYGASVLAGVKMPVPIFGEFEFTVDLTKPTVQGQGWDYGNIKISRNFLYDLTERVQIGFTLVYAKTNLRSGKRFIQLFPTVYPVIGATVQL